MVEYESATDRYEPMTPVERHSEMEHIFKLIPSDEFVYDVDEGNTLFPVDDAEIIDTRIAISEKREKSAYKHGLSDKLSNLLLGSELTNGAQRYVVMRFEEIYDLGRVVNSVEQIEEEKDILASTLGWEESGTSGVFDPERVKDLESAMLRRETSLRMHIFGFQQRLDNHDVFSEEFEAGLKESYTAAKQNEMLEFLLPEDERRKREDERAKEDDYATALIEKDKEVTENFNQWRNDFFDKYGELP